jgi:hypothetical protein
MCETVAFNITPWSVAPEPEFDENVRLIRVRHLPVPAALIETGLRELCLKRQARGNSQQFAFTVIRRQYNAGSDGDIMCWLREQLRCAAPRTYLSYSTPC